MGLFDLFRREKMIGGAIGYYGLTEWWESAFTAEEKNYITGKYDPIAPPGVKLASGPMRGTGQRKDAYLIALATWFRSKGDAQIASRILEKAEALQGQLPPAQAPRTTASRPSAPAPMPGGDMSDPVLGKHFLYSEKVKAHYSAREQPGELDKAVEACRAQIAIAPQAAAAFKRAYPKSGLPSHRGYKQLAIILEKRKQYDEAIALCKQAKRERWKGDWAKRIERCEKRRKATAKK